MRLLFLSNMYPPDDVGGLEQLCQEVTESLRQRGHHVEILTSKPDSDVANLHEPGIRRELYLQADRHRYRPMDFFFKRLREERLNELALRRAIRDVVPDVLVVWGMWNLTRNLPYWAEKLLPGRTAHYIASYWPMDVDVHVQYWRSPTKKIASRWLMLPARAFALGILRLEKYPPKPRLDHTMCCSHYVRETLVNAHVLPETAGVLRVGIDPDSFVIRLRTEARDDNDRIRLIYCGTLSAQKGVDTAIKALGFLRDEGYIEQVALTILGGGHPDYEAYLRHLAEQLEIGGHVTFAGRVSRDKVQQWLADSDIFLFTSTWPEPMARSVMEAMAEGLLVIGAEVGGQIEMMVSGKNALTFSPGDSQALARQIVRAIQEPDLRAQLASAGKEMVLREFTLERMVSNFEAWLGDIAR